MDETSKARLDIVSKWAAKYGLDPALVAAVCEQESSWNTYAVRWEPAFFAHYIVPLGLKDPTEATCRAMSFGFMQVMGQVARERGFKEQFLTRLCDPDFGLDTGCDVLKSKIALAGGDVTAGLLKYNGGGNTYYPSQVLARVAKYQETA